MTPHVSPVSSEAKSRATTYRQCLRQCGDAIYVNLGTMFGSPSCKEELADLWLMLNMGRSLRSSLRAGKLLTTPHAALCDGGEGRQLRQCWQVAN